MRNKVSLKVDLFGDMKYHFIKKSLLNLIQRLLHQVMSWEIKASLPL